MSSLKKRFSKMQLTFVVLAVLITAQMLILFLLHRRQADRLEAANGAMKDYMELVKEQNILFEKIYSMSDGGDKTGLDKINEEVRAAKESVLKWGQRSIANSLISSAVIADEKRRADSLQKSAELLWQQKYKEAMKVLDLERKSFFSRSLSITNILDEVIEEGEVSGLFITSFFLISIFLNVPVFIMLLLNTSRLQVSVEKDVKGLIGLTEAIKNGKMNTEQGVALLAETAELRTAFREMELDLRNRNLLSKQEVNRTKESNVELEQKVEKSNSELGKAHELLLRKNEELEQILYAASHDLRTPLIGVQGFSQELQYLCDMLGEEIEKSEIKLEEGNRIQGILKQDIPNSVNFIIKGSNKMDTMIQGLLRISKVGLENIKAEKVDMDEMIRQIVDSVSFQAQSSNTMILPEPLVDCCGDKDKLEQVFTNLIVNSIKYRKEDVSCEIKISCEKDGHFVKYYVEDNGIGISKENLEKVFKTFYRVHDEDSNGEGLGLTIANRIVEKHEGLIHVESEEGQGCRFIISLPAYKEEAVKQEALVNE